MSTVNIGSESVAEWQAGHGTVGTSPAQLSIAFKVLKHVYVRANAGNSGTITIGSSSARADAGFILAAGDTSPPIHVDDASKVWLVGSGSGQNYSWLSV